MNSLEEAKEMLLNLYAKILKVDLVTGSFEIIKTNEDGLEDFSTLDGVFEAHVNAGIIHEEDTKFYLDNTRRDYVCDYFSKNKGNLSLRFRRLTRSGYKWVIMEFVPVYDYSEDNKVAFVIIKDVDVLHANEMDEHSDLKYQLNYDLLTGLRNFNSYKKTCEEAEKIRKSVGVVFADLNALKVVNDSRGHDSGNEYICRFSNLVKEMFPGNGTYRISGDEFVIIQFDISEDEMFEKKEKLVKEIKKDYLPMASIGYSWGDSAENIKDVIRRAESNMYGEKQLFYEMHPEMSRGAFEERHRQEMNAIVMSFAEAYPTLGVVNIREDTYRLIKLDKAVGDMINVPTYSQYIEIFLSRITSDSKYKMFHICGVGNLRRELHSREVVTEKFQMKDGHWREITFRRVAVEDGYPTKVIFYARQIDK